MLSSICWRNAKTDPPPETEGFQVLGLRDGNFALIERYIWETGQVDWWDPGVGMVVPPPEWWIDPRYIPFPEQVGSFPEDASHG